MHLSPASSNRCTTHVQMQCVFVCCVIERRCRAEVKRHTESIRFSPHAWCFFFPAVSLEMEEGSDMRLTLKAVQVIPVWIAAHRLVFPTNIFVWGHDPQRCVLNNSSGSSQFQHVPHCRQIKMHGACQQRSLHSQ